MKNTLVFILVLFLLAGAVPSFAEETDNSGIYEQIQKNEYISVEDAFAQIGLIESSHPEIQEFQRLLNGLQSCDGRFVQLPDENGSGKIYTADVVFYLAKGTPYCSIEYTGYGGTISHGTVEAAFDGEYMFVSHPAGEFFSNNTVFTLEFAPDQLHIQWADGLCEYLLVRGTEEQLASANKELPFVETDSYKSLVQTIGKAFNGMDYTCRYEEESKIFTVYVACGAGYKNTLINHAEKVQDKWQGILDIVLSFSKDVDDALTFATRKGLADYTQAQFTIVFVEGVYPNYTASEDDRLAVVTDGKITYNIIDETLKGKNTASDYTHSTPSTIGESNALRQAKLYLEVMPFSYKGLVEQLEYEGYSHSEAVFGASNSGTNWYEQAVETARNYLDLMPFSRSGLIDQLEYDGYTYDQAVYGVEKNGY